MGAYQNAGLHTDDGAATQYFDSPAGPPDVAFAYPTASLAPAGHIGVTPDPVQPRSILTPPPGNIGKIYSCLCRYNHSLNTLAFYRETKTIPNYGTVTYTHGLGMVPDFYGAMVAAYPGVAAVSWAMLDTVDDNQIQIKNWSNSPIDIEVYAWLLHSVDVPIASSGPVDGDLVAGGPPVDFNHGLGVVPDFFLMFPYQAAADPNPDGFLKITGAPDATKIIIQNQHTGPGNDLQIRAFFQRTFSVQT